MELRPKQLELLEYWINEREAVRLRRERGDPWPWTDNVPLRDRHFCNIRREDDRGTKEIHAVRKELDPPLQDYPMFYTMARMFNKASSARDYWLYGPEYVKAQRARGQPVFHVAYVVSTCGRRMDKIDYLTEVVTDVSRVNPSMICCHDAFEVLRTVNGLGSFMCGQVIADLKYTPYLKNAVDWYGFAVMGPGSKKGLDLIFGPGTTENTFMYRLKALRKELEGKIPTIHNQDLQNCLCEFSKFAGYVKNTNRRTRNYAKPDNSKR